MRVTGDKDTRKKVVFKTTMGDDAKSVIQPWWGLSDSNKAAAQIVTTAAYLKESQGYRYRQAAVYARLYGNQSLYSFAGNQVNKMDQQYGLPQDRPTFNLIQSAADTLVSRISQSRPQPVFLTDGSDYKQRNLAKKLNNFVQGEFFNISAYDKATLILRDALVEGTGVAHVYEDDDNRVAMERVLLTELLVDPNEAMYGEPRQLYRIKLVDRQVLAAAFPNFKAKIEMAAQAYPDNSTDSSKSVSDLVMVVESWHLPSGKKAKDGRHMLAISSGYLIDEDYNKKTFPFVFLHYSPRMLGFWAQGLAEQLMGTQMELNALLYTISKSIKIAGTPKVLVEEGSKINSASIDNQIGTIVKYRGTPPQWQVNASNAPELYAERDKLIQYGYQQCGVSSLQATSQKPQGLNSGEAIRSYDDISTDRFASLAKRYDNFFVDLAYLVIDLAKDIADRDKEYKTVYPGKNGTQQVDLPAADLLNDTYIIQAFTQSSLPKDPAGRLAKITEMITSGMITIQEGRRLLDYPDLEQVEKLANAGQERVFQVLDKIVDEGEYTPIDPFMPVEFAETTVVQYINLYGAGALEEEKMQMLRDFYSQIQTLKAAATPQQPTAPGAVPGAPAASIGEIPQPGIIPPPPNQAINSQVS